MLKGRGLLAGNAHTEAPLGAEQAPHMNGLGKLTALPLLVQGMRWRTATYHIRCLGLARGSNLRCKRPASAARSPPASRPPQNRRGGGSSVQKPRESPSGRGGGHPQASVALGGDARARQRVSCRLDPDADHRRRGPDEDLLLQPHGCAVRRRWDPERARSRWADVMRDGPREAHFDMTPRWGQRRGARRTPPPRTVSPDGRRGAAEAERGALAFVAGTCR